MPRSLRSVPAMISRTGSQGQQNIKCCRLRGLELPRPGWRCLFFRAKGTDKSTTRAARLSTPA